MSRADTPGCFVVFGCPRVTCGMHVPKHSLSLSLSISLTYSYLITVVNRLEIDCKPSCHQRWVISEDSTRMYALSPPSPLPVVKSSVCISRVLYHLSLFPVHTRISERIGHLQKHCWLMVLL